MLVRIFSGYDCHWQTNSGCEGVNLGNFSCFCMNMKVLLHTVSNSERLLCIWTLALGTGRKWRAGTLLCSLRSCCLLYKAILSGTWSLAVFIESIAMVITFWKIIKLNSLVVSRHGNIIETETYNCVSWHLVNCGIAQCGMQNEKCGYKIRNNIDCSTRHTTWLKLMCSLP